MVTSAISLGWDVSVCVKRCFRTYVDKTQQHAALGFLIVGNIPRCSCTYYAGIVRMVNRSLKIYCRGIGKLGFGIQPELQSY